MTATFAELQNEFQRCILEGDDTILGALLDGSKEQRANLFEVYRHAYVARLVEALRTTHELLHAYLGDDDFDEMARAYVVATPSRTPNLRWLSRKLPDFLRTHEPYKDHPVIADFAAIENALDDAFDSADAPILTLTDLAAIPPDAWNDLCLDSHDCVRRIEASTNALAIWSALRDDETPPDVETLSSPAHLVVWRHDAVSMVREISDEEAMMWDEAENGVPFGVLCTMLATYDDPGGAATRAAGYLHGWITSGMLTSVATDP